ncbi:Smr/MutS family protein [Nocardia sp. NPDC004604]|uniref:Smr/MutS family protein n=1 Tax=Nocardia sp. NPDC004604 TaxID=3157013 RepID=UPI0033A9671A
MLTVDLHPVFRSDRDIDNAVRSAIFRAVAQKVGLLEIIPGKGSGTLKRRVLAKLAQPSLKSSTGASRQIRETRAGFSFISDRSVPTP